MDWENDVPLSPEEPVSSPHSYKSAMNESSKRFVANKTAKTVMVDEMILNRNEMEENKFGEISNEEGQEFDEVNYSNLVQNEISEKEQERLEKQRKMDELSREMLDARKLFDQLNNDECNDISDDFYNEMNGESFEYDEIVNEQNQNSLDSNLEVSEKEMEDFMENGEVDCENFSNDNLKRAKPRRFSEVESDLSDCPDPIDAAPSSGIARNRNQYKSKQDLNKKLKPKVSEAFKNTGHQYSKTAKAARPASYASSNNIAEPPKKYLFFRPPDCLNVTVHLHNQDIRYLTRKNREAYDREAMKKLEQINRERQCNSTALLERPMDEIFDSIREENYQRELLARTLENTKISSKKAGEKKVIPGELFVDKYSPTIFSDLLSDEVINRNVAQWLTSWDPIVFPEKKKHIEPVRFDAKTKFENRVAPAGNARPFHKVILLSGPPGCGKTTLAHVVAKHCGYRVCEVNSSDDRSTEALKKRIIDAVQMKSVSFTDTRPNCLILDEIDGVATSSGKSGVTALVEMIQASDRYYNQLEQRKSKASNSFKKGSQNKDMDTDAKLDDVEEDEEDELTPKKKSNNEANAIVSKSKSKSVLLINRPIICICNDLYAPSLRPLRAIAKVFQFSKLTSQRLAERLKIVCRLENILTDSRSLLALCEMAENDIRSCLNTLQFICSKSKISGAEKPRLTLESLAFLNIGLKDQTRDLLDIWKLTFQLPRTKLTSLEQMKSSKDSKPAFLSSSIVTRGSSPLLFTYFNTYCNQYHNASGDSNRIILGVYENYASVKYTDPMQTKSSDLMEWICHADIFSKSGSDISAGFSPYVAYVPYCLLGVHMIVAQPVAPKITLPHLDFDNKMVISRNQNILESWMEGNHSQKLTVLSRLGWTTETILLDVLSPLLTILNPKIRPVNVYMMNQEEKTALNKLVRNLVSCGLNYRLERNDNAIHEPSDGSFKPASLLNYQLEPPVHLLCRFSGISRSNELANDLKKLLIHEIFLYESKLLSNSRKLSQDNRGVTHVPLPKHILDAQKSSAVVAPENRGATTALRTCLPSSHPLISSKVIDGADENSDAKNPSFMIQQKKKKQERIRYPIHFVYQEGFTNAVRRPVYVKDLLN